MFGSGMGTLTVKSSEDVLWSKTENQGFSWHKAKIHIPSTDNLKVIKSQMCASYNQILEWRSYE